MKKREVAKSKRMKRPASSRRKPSETGRAKVFIVGESPMVEEYAELCALHGYDVFADWNEPAPTAPTWKSERIRRASTIPPDTSLALELTNVDLSQKRKNLQSIDKVIPSDSAVVSSSVSVTASEQSSWVMHRERLVGMSALPTLTEKLLVEIAPTVFSPKETVEVVQRFFRSIGKEIALVQDRVGMVFPRLLCHVVNEACHAMQEEIASPQDADAGMRVAMNFPRGPIEWANTIGMQQVLAILTALQNDLADDRYRISPLLRQLVQSREWWKQA